MAKVWEKKFWQSPEELKAAAISVESVKANEAVFPAQQGGDPDEYQWTPYGSRSGLGRTRNLPAVTQEEMMSRSVSMYAGNPIGHRTIDITPEFCLSDGIVYRAEDEQIQRILNQHWTNLTNRWATLQNDRLRDLGLFGEMLITATVSPNTGQVELGNIDPSLIDKVIDDPMNTMKSHAVVIKKMPKETIRRIYKIVDIAQVSDGEAFGRLVGLPQTDQEKTTFGFNFKMGEEGTLKDMGFNVLNDRGKVKWAGTVFYTKVNSPISASRGWGDLLWNLDWMDAHDQFLFAQVEKAIESAQWVWDITAQGMSESDMREWAKNQPGWKPGHRYVHNEFIKIAAQTSNLHLEDATTLGTALKNHILGGSSFPPIWFAEASTARAVGPEMTDPTFKHLRIRQRVFAELMQLVFRFTIDQAILAKYVKFDGRRKQDIENEPSSFYLKLPDLSSKDQRALSIAIRNFTGAMKDVVDLGVFSADEAGDYTKRYLELTGLDTMKDAPSYDFNVTPNEQFNGGTVFGAAQESGLAEIHTQRGTFFVNGNAVIQQLSENTNGEKDWDKFEKALTNGSRL